MPTDQVAFDKWAVPTTARRLALWVLKRRSMKGLHTRGEDICFALDISGVKCDMIISSLLSFGDIVIETKDGVVFLEENEVPF